MTVGDFIELANIATGIAHRPSATCKCNECTHARRSAVCANPHLCATRAKEMLSTLPGKWDPRRKQPEDYEDKIMNDSVRTSYLSIIASQYTAMSAMHCAYSLVRALCQTKEFRWNWMKTDQ